MDGIVDSCPQNLTEAVKASTRLGCGRDKYGNNQYICLPNAEKSGLVELCHSGIMGLVEKGYCLETTEGNLFSSDCSGFIEGCPKVAYRSNKNYNYPACQQINTEDHCYLADPSCSITTQNLALGVYNTTTINNQTTTIQEYQTADIGAIVGGLCAGGIILIVLLFLGVLLWRRKRIQGLKNKTFEPNPHELEPLLLRKYEYDEWRTQISDSFSDLNDDEVSVLFCFMCTDSGTPDFADKEYLDILNEIRRIAYNKGDEIQSDEALWIFERLRSSEFLLVDEEKIIIANDAADETMYRISSRNPFITFYLSSFSTAWNYLRSKGYSKKRGEKCVISTNSECDTLLVQRLQMNILTHVSMNDTDIHAIVSKTLNVPQSTLKMEANEREDLLLKLKQTGEHLPKKRNSQHTTGQLKWLWRYKASARPDIVRSCVGLFSHWDMYVIDNIVYRKPSKWHRSSIHEKFSFYSPLFFENFTIDVDNNSHVTLLKNIRREYFKDLEKSKVKMIPDVIKKEKNRFTFGSEGVRDDIFAAFVTEYMEEYSDLDFFLNSASPTIISIYIRSYRYNAGEGERNIFIPKENYYNLIDRLQLSILKCCSNYDDDVHKWISDRLKVPIEILKWDQEARERYITYANRGTQTVHHARGMIVGCAGAGKTTLLNRLLKKSEKEIKAVTSTIGMEVHEEIFEIHDGILKVRQKENDENESTATTDVNDENQATSEPLLTEDGEQYVGNTNSSPVKKVSFFDFGGQCAYYACHQVYLTRRAFYILVIDASRGLEKVVDRAICDQEDTLFASWTYADYIAFWMKSILTFSFSDVDKNPEVIVVASHWEENKYENASYTFIQNIRKNLPSIMDSQSFIPRENYFFIQFPLSPLEELEKHIVDIASDSRWSENVPKEWTFFDVEIKKHKHSTRILNFSDILSKMPGKSNKKQSVQDMLRFYHDAGKVLYFNEAGLDEIVIINVQWFVDAFKNTITDRLHTCGISKTNADLKLYYQTGHLKDTLLTEIWRIKDEKLLQSLEGTLKQTADFEKDPRCIMYHKKKVLTVMQRLGLMALGDLSHYVPCMNRKVLPPTVENMVYCAQKKTPAMVFLFDFLPYFLYFRLIVGCIQNKKWKVCEDGKSLFRNASFFEVSEHFVVVSVTGTSIIVQVYHTLEELNPSTTVEIKNDLIKILQSITESFHRKISFKVGFICRKYKKIGEEIDDDFIEEIVLFKRSGNKEVCPRHQVAEYHEIEPNEFKKYWKE